MRVNLLSSSKILSTLKIRENNIKCYFLHKLFLTYRTNKIRIFFAVFNNILVLSSAQYVLQTKRSMKTYPHITSRYRELWSSDSEHKESSHNTSRFILLDISHTVQGIKESCGRMTQRRIESRDSWIVVCRLLVEYRYDRIGYQIL